jgi:hypothetical protein
MADKLLNVFTLLKSKPMKKLIYLAFTFIIVVVLAAEFNYAKAVKKATESEGTDMAIEMAMSEYGFYIDAMDTTIPSPVTKLKALFRIDKKEYQMNISESFVTIYDGDRIVGSCEYDSIYSLLLKDNQ